LEKDTEFGELKAGEGLEYAAPKPPEVHGYTLVYGEEPANEPAISVPVLDQATEVTVCDIDGLVYKDPNPDDQAYAFKVAGLMLLPIAITFPTGENLTLKTVPPIGVEGLAYFVPNPDDVTGYAAINGLEVLPIATSLVIGLKDIEFWLLPNGGNVAGFAYLVP